SRWTIRISKRTVLWWKALGARAPEVQELSNSTSGRCRADYCSRCAYRFGQICRGYVTRRRERLRHASRHVWRARRTVECGGKSRVPYSRCSQWCGVPGRAESERFRCYSRVWYVWTNKSAACFEGRKSLASLRRRNTWPSDKANSQGNLLSPG